MFGYFVMLSEFCYDKQSFQLWLRALAPTQLKVLMITFTKIILLRLILIKNEAEQDDFCESNH